MAHGQYRATKWQVWLPALLPAKSQNLSIAVFQLLGPSNALRQAHGGIVCAMRRDTPWMQAPIARSA